MEIPLVGKVLCSSGSRRTPSVSFLTPPSGAPLRRAPSLTVSFDLLLLSLSLFYAFIATARPLSKGDVRFPVSWLITEISGVATKLYLVKASEFFENRRNTRTQISELTSLLVLLMTKLVERLHNCGWFSTFLTLCHIRGPALRVSKLICDICRMNMRYPKESTTVGEVCQKNK